MAIVVALVSVVLLALLAGFISSHGDRSRPDSPKSTRPRSAPQSLLKEGLSTLLEIQYADAEGKESVRTVTLHQIYGHPSSKHSRSSHLQNISTYCHLRKEPRTFRIDRIQALIDLDTGEALTRSDPNGAALIRQYFMNLVDGKPVARTFADGPLLDQRIEGVEIDLHDGDRFQGTLCSVERVQGRLTALAEVTRIAGRRKWSGVKRFKGPTIRSITIGHVTYVNLDDLVRSQNAHPEVTATS